MKHFTFILVALLTVIVLSSCGVSQEVSCFNYCSKTIYYSDFSGIVQDTVTKKPISGAIITLTESEDQICDTCVTLGTITLITDEEGWFKVPPEIYLPNRYNINVDIVAENCIHYNEDYRAFHLVGAERIPGEVFELSCS